MIGGAGQRSLRLTGRRRLGTGTVVVLAALAGAGLGSVVGGGPEQRPAPIAARGVQVVTAPGFRLTLGPDWWRDRGTQVPDGAVVVQGPRSELTAVRGAIDDPSLLPAALVRRLLQRPAFGATIRRGALVAAAYPRLTLRDSRAQFAAIAVPTTAGEIVLACWGSRGSVESAAGECDDALAGLRVTDGRALTPRPDLAFGAALPAIVDHLAAARRRERARLADAVRPGDRATAARALAGDLRADRGVLEQRSGGTPPEQATLQALDGLAGAYDDLAGAAVAGDRARYLAAGATIGRGERAVDVLLEGWRRRLAGS